MVFAHVQVAIVLLVVQQNVVVEDHCFTVLTVLVSLLDKKGNPLSRRCIAQLDLRALSVELRRLLGMLQIHERVDMSQLDLTPVQNLFTVLLQDPVFIIDVLLLDPPLKHFELHLVGLSVIDILFGLRLALGLFHLSFEFFHRVVAQFRYNLENHITVVDDRRGMQLRALMHINLR